MPLDLLSIIRYAMTMKKFLNRLSCKLFGHVPSAWQNFDTRGPIWTTIASGVRCSVCDTDLLSDQKAPVPKDLIATLKTELEAHANGTYGLTPERANTLRLMLEKHDA